MTTQQIKAAIEHYTKLVQQNKGESLMAYRQLGKLFKVSAAEQKRFGTKAYVVLCLSNEGNELIHEPLREKAVQAFRDWAVPADETYDPATGYWIQHK